MVRCYGRLPPAPAPALPAAQSRARPTQPGWRASGNVVGANHSAGPTGFNTAANLFYAIPINQRASYRWMPVPGSELYWPATNVTGLAISASVASGVVLCLDGDRSATYTE